MRATTVDDPQTFLLSTRELRAEQPILTNVIGSVAGSVVDGRRYDPCFWWLVHDDDGALVGCAMRTAPWKLVLSGMPPAAAAALGRSVATVDAGLPGFIGPEELVQAFLAGLAQPREPAVGMTDLVYALDRLVDPPPTPGGPRAATEQDLDLVMAWHEQFAIDAGLPAHDVGTSVRARLAQRALWLWELDGGPVSMAGHAPPVDAPGGAVGRVGPVYTPEHLRRRGFGAAVTATVVRELERTCGTIMLFADAANPTSNSVYRRLGFRPVTTLVEVGLA